MKKLYFFILSFSLILILNGSVFATDNIVITSPTGSSKWRKGTPHTIRWETPGIAGDYAVRLRETGSTLVGKIINTKTNYSVVGSVYRFTVNWSQVGHCLEGVEVPPGKKYYIRVRNKNGGADEYTDSPEFEIYDILNIKPPKLYKERKIRIPDPDPGPYKDKDKVKQQQLEQQQLNQQQLNQQQLNKEVQQQVQ